MSLNDKKQIVNKFGIGLVTTAETSIWSGSTGSTAVSGLKSLPPDTGVKLKVSSDSANDTNEGTGAWTVVVNGLDTDFLPQQETVTLNGQTAVETVHSYTRVCRSWVETADSVTGQDGNIFIGSGTVTSGVPETIYAKISIDGATSADGVAAKNQTQQACFTIPKGYQGRIYGIDYAREDEGGNVGDCVVYFKTKSIADNQVWRIRENTLLGEGTSHSIDYTDQTEPLFTELTDIDVTGAVDTGDTAVTAKFDLVLDRVEDVASSMTGSLTISDYTDKGFTVAWDSVDNTNFLNGYKITVIDEDTGWTAAYTAQSSATSFILNKLLDGHTYTVQVQSFFGSGLSNALEETELEVGLEVPTGFTATNTESAGIDLAWTDESTKELAFEIERDDILIHTTDEDVESYTDDDISFGSTYSYRVRAVAGSESSPWTTAEVVAYLPLAPSTLTATAGDGTVDLSWTIESSLATEQKIYRGTVTGVYTLLHTIEDNSTSTYADNTVVNDTTYYYVVTASDGEFESVNSNEEDATPTAATGSTFIIGQLNPDDIGSLNGLYSLSTDSGDTWTTDNIIGPPGKAFYVGTLPKSPQSGSEIIATLVDATTSYVGLYKTTDGTTWPDMTLGGVLATHSWVGDRYIVWDETNWGEFNASTSTYTMNTGTDEPDNTNGVLVAGNGTVIVTQLADGNVAYSSDSGETWTASSDQPSAGQEAVQFLQVGTRIFRIDDDATVHYTDDGDTWTDTSVGFTATDLTGGYGSLGYDGTYIFAAVTADYTGSEIKHTDPTTISWVADTPPAAMGFCVFGTGSEVIFYADDDSFTNGAIYSYNEPTFTLESSPANSPVVAGFLS